MNCMYCKGKMEKKTAPFHVNREKYHLTLDKIPAWVCTQCGEAYFEEHQVEEIQKVIETLDKKTQKLVSAA